MVQSEAEGPTCEQPLEAGRAQNSRRWGPGCRRYPKVGAREGFLAEGVCPVGASEDEEGMKRSSQWAEWGGGGDPLRGPVTMRRRG